MKNSEIWIPGEKKFNPQYENKPAGGIIINGQEIAHTLQCVHCGIHFVSIRGSGKKRGYCRACNGVLCGSKKCFEHIPYKVKVEYRSALKRNREATIKEILKQYPNIK